MRYADPYVLDLTFFTTNSLCHARLDRAAMPSLAMDTRVRGYDGYRRGYDGYRRGYDNWLRRYGGEMEGREPAQV